MSTHNHLQPSAAACLAAPAPRLSLLQDLKLMFAALGAGNRVVPLGDNSRTARLLADYAASLRDH